MADESTWAEYVRLFELVNQAAGLAGSLEVLAEKDRFARAITGDRALDLWRAWRDARTSSSKERPLEATRRIKRARRLHPEDSNRGLVDIEIDALMGQCALELQAGGLGREYWDRVRNEILSFASMVRDKPEWAAKQVAGMLGCLMGVSDVEYRGSAQDICHAWALARGTKLVLEATSQLLTVSWHRDDLSEIADRARFDLNEFCKRAGIQLDKKREIEAEFAFGNCWTPVDPGRALEHFERTIGMTSPENGLWHQAIANAGNCLLRLHRYVEAADRYMAVESFLEGIGDYVSAARVWSSECIARWNAGEGPELLGSIIGAIKMFESNLPGSADQATLYALKQFIDPAYALFLSVVTDDSNRSRERQDQVISVLWAMLSREYRAALEPDEPDDAWGEVLARQGRPLAFIESTLAAVPGTAVIHLCSTPDRLAPSEMIELPVGANLQRLTWVIYGFDTDRKFRFEISAVRSERSGVFYDFLEAMEQQLSADLRLDSVAVDRLDVELSELGDRLTAELGTPFVAVLKSMDRLFVAPVPFADVDEFPIHGLRIDGAWLGASKSLTRAPTSNYLREILNPNTRLIHGTADADIILGEHDSEASRLNAIGVEADRMQHVLGLLGFKPRMRIEPDNEQVMELLDGGSGLVHYIGHGIANHSYEGLPLSGDEMFRAVDLDRLDGMKTPFVFLCACEAARVRHGGGGYQIGLASKLVERGAPGVLAFTTPITEKRAYHIARQFYREAHKNPFGEAVRAARDELSRCVPAYAWLALSAYGDPFFHLSSVPGGGTVPRLADHTKSWHSDFRNALVLRTDEAWAAAEAAVQSASDEWRALAKRFFTLAFQASVKADDPELAQLEAEALKRAEASAEALSLRAGVALERAHRIGLDSELIRFPEPGEQTRRLFVELALLAKAGAAFFDTRLNGLGNALLGRLIAWDQKGIEQAEVLLVNAAQKLQECAAISPYVHRIREETIQILRQYGGPDLG